MRQQRFLVNYYPIQDLIIIACGLWIQILLIPTYKYRHFQKKVKIQNNFLF